MLLMIRTRRLPKTFKLFYVPVLVNILNNPQEYQIRQHIIQTRFFRFPLTN